VSKTPRDRKADRILVRQTNGTPGREKVPAFEVSDVRPAEFSLVKRPL
jgi:hypothetical protein